MISQMTDRNTDYCQRMAKYADVTAFLDKHGVHEDGHASERAVDFILGLLDSKEKL